MEGLVDTHAHLDMPEFRGDLEAVLDRARAAGLVHVVSVSIDLPSLERNLSIAAANAGFVSVTAGVHPHDAAASTPADWSSLETLAADPRVVGIGETGLDFYRDRAPRPLQEELFRRHVDLALALGKPLVVHSRDAFEDTLRVLEETGARSAGGVFHCFSEGPGAARRALELGFAVSIAGPVTYPRSRLPEVVRAVPVERILLETDAPFLAPQGRRGSRNEPAFLAETAAAVAAARGLSPDDVRRVSTRCACGLFGLPCAPSVPAIAYRIRGALYLNVTNRCPNRCVFCARETAPTVKGHDLRLESEPGPGELLEAAGDVSGYDEVVFCGYGEPLLRWDAVLEVARALKARGARIRINTNGLARRFHGRDILPEMDGVVDALSVSLNAADARTYERLCRPESGPGAFEAVKAFVRDARRHVPSVVATVVAVPGLDLEACRRVAVEELGAAFRVRPHDEVG